MSKIHRVPVSLDSMQELSWTEEHVDITYFKEKQQLDSENEKLDQKFKKQSKKIPNSPSDISLLSQKSDISSKKSSEIDNMILVQSSFNRPESDEENVEADGFSNDVLMRPHDNWFEGRGIISYNLQYSMDCSLKSGKNFKCLNVCRKTHKCYTWIRI